MSNPSGPPPKAPRLASSPSNKASRRARACSVAAEAHSNGVATRLNVYARLPPSCPFVGSFHYAPSAGNRAYSFFEGQIVPHRETRRLHKIRTNPLTGNFHSRPGHYSRLHGLQNFRSEFEGLSAAEDGGMTAIIARIKTTLTEPSSPAVAEATAEDNVSVRFLAKKGFPPPPELANGRPHLGPLARTLPAFRSRHSACDALSAAEAKRPDGGAHATGRAAVYSKYWELADTERGRFGTSVDDNALGASSQQSAAAGAAAADGMMVAAAVAAGVRGIGKGGVHWGKHHHHHHHSFGSDEGEGAREPLIGDATAKLRHLYFQQNRPTRPSAVVAAQRARIQVTVAARAAAAGAGARQGGGSRGGGGNKTPGIATAAPRAAATAATRGKSGPILQTRRSMPDTWAASAASDPSGDRGGGAAAAAAATGAAAMARRSTVTGQGWESHTLKAQQETKQYMRGREDLAPDMRPDVVLDNEVSLAYDVDVSDTGMLGAGAYGTVLAAVHRSTGRQVAIKTMLKKYLFSDAEKASVEREIEIQQRLVNNHVIRLYEIYQSPENLYLVVERAPCGTLEEYLYVRRRMNELDAKRVVRQLLDGLAYLHKVGVVHCDLKPANILFSDIDQGTAASTDLAVGGEDGGSQPVTPRAQATTPPASLSGLVVKICDFGHARKVPDCRYYKFTGDINKIPFHMFKHTGTDGFVAPEVLRSEPYGKAADMWSTGCMLYQMLTGRMPWIPSRACLQRPLSTSGPSWKNISEPAKSLVGDLLTADQEFRADVEQATHHPWFEGIHHCARMPTSAPGGKASVLSPVRRARRLSLGEAPRSVMAPRRDEGVRSGDVAAGGGGSSPARPASEENKKQAGRIDSSTAAPAVTTDIAVSRDSAANGSKRLGTTADLSVKVA